MRTDLELVASLARNASHGPEAAAEVYRQRLARAWLVQRDRAEDVRGFGLVVKGGADLPIADLGAGPLQIWNLAVNAANLDQRTDIATRGSAADLYTVSRAGAESRFTGHTGWKVTRRSSHG